MAVNGERNLKYFIFGKIGQIKRIIKGTVTKVATLWTNRRYFRIFFHFILFLSILIAFMYRNEHP